MAIGFLGLLAALILFLYFLDWNTLRGPIGRYLSHRTGREIRIDGNLAVQLFRWQPTMSAEKIFVGNPPWVGRHQAATVQRFRLETRLVPLIFGHVELPMVALDQPDVLVLRGPDGRSNWDRRDAAPGEAWVIPPINRFLVNQGHVVIHDAVRKLDFTGTINSQEVQGGRQQGFTLAGDGTLNRARFSADVKGGPLLNVDESRPYDFTADIHAGDTHVTARGSVIQPFHLDRYTAALEVTGPSLADIYDLTGLAMPRTPPYHLALAVEREGTVYRLTDINGQLGNSDLAGNLSVDVSGTVPALAGKLASRSLDFDDLGAVVGGGKAMAHDSNRLLPDTPLRTERLKQTNAEIDYSATRVTSRDFPLTGLDTHIALEGGVLKLDPLAFVFTQGKLAGSLTIDARKDVPLTTVDARISDARIENFIKSADKPLSGMVEARAKLTGSGNSVHKVASTADGTFTAVIPSGGMRRSLAEWAGVDVLSGLGLSLSGDQSNTQLRCAVAQFGVRDGAMTAQRLVIDTEPVRIDGSGGISLGDETVDLKLQGKPKHFQLLRLRAPIHVKGGWAQPSLGVDAGPALAQGGLGAALGLLNPLAAIFAFVDPGLAKDANCAPLLADAKAKGAPIHATQMKNAPAPRK